MESNEKGLIVSGILCIFCGLFFFSKAPNLPALGLFMLGLGCFIIIIALVQTNQKQNGTRPNEQQQREIERRTIEREREEAIRSQSEGAPWERIYTYPCPYCGHYKVRPANWDDKRMSVAFWGAASSKIGDRYKCEYCKRTWK